VASRFGGSHAQRDVITLTLIEAALRGRQLTLARALLSERTALKPESPFAWASTIRTLKLLGDESGAEKVARKSATLSRDPATEAMFASAA
jgi:hypothetical protein